MNALATVPTAPPRTRPQPRPRPTDHRVTAHLALVTGIAARIARRHRLDLCGLEIDDLVAIGTEALIEAARRFDPGRGAALATFAYHRVQGAMLDAIRANGCYRNRQADPTVLVVSLQAHEATCLALPDERTLPDEAVDSRHLHAAIAKLPATERRLIQGCYLEGRTLDQIGAELGKSRSWACRLLNRAISMLRQALLD